MWPVCAEPVIPILVNNVDVWEYLKYREMAQNDSA